jgi:hypothetical protein
MSKRYASTDEFFHELRSLIDAWCDRRCVLALAILLPAYTSFNGLTDGWGELLAALRTLRLSKDELTPNELVTLAELTQAAERSVHRR